VTAPCSAQTLPRTRLLPNLTADGLCPGVGVVDHEVTPKAPWTGSGWREYSYGGVRGRASALGERSLRDRQDPDLIYVGLGTGVGAAWVTDGRLAVIELSHRPRFGRKVCEGCGRLGCIDAQIGGHALPDPLTGEALDQVIGVLSAVLMDSGIRADTAVVVGGGMARSHPQIISGLRGRTGLVVEPSRAAPLKSASSIATFEKVAAG